MTEWNWEYLNTHELVQCYLKVGLDQLKLHTVNLKAIVFLKNRSVIILIKKRRENEIIYQRSQKKKRKKKKTRINAMHKKQLQTVSIKSKYINNNLNGNSINAPMKRQRMSG